MLILNDCDCLFENDVCCNKIFVNDDKCMLDNICNYNKNLKFKEISVINKNFIKYDMMSGRPSIELEINNNHVRCLLDTGARISVIENSLLKMLGIFKIESTEVSVRCANESNLKILGKVRINVKLNDEIKNILFYIADSISPSMIGGINLLKEFDIELIMKSSKDYIRENIKFINNLETTDKYNLENCDDINVNKIVKDFEIIFMKHKWDVGKTNLLKHEIMTNSKPIASNPRRQPYHLLDKIDGHIKEMELNGIISRCDSPWNSPLVCVKKQGTDDIRLCLDYRELNAVTERPIFPIPNTEEMMDILNGTKYFSTIDLGNAYYQVELDEKSKMKTAFSTKYAQYYFNRMPFGIAAAPATFQKLMNKVLGEMNGIEAMVYLDDILIFSKNKQDHYKRIRNIFKRIEAAGLKINPNKCHFMKETIQFLGHTIDKNGIKTNEKKIMAIKNFDRPKCIKVLRSFLGLSNYYRRFIKDYTKYSKILESLCGSNQKKLIWTDECEQAFIMLKNELTKTPVLSFPDFSKEFILDTDASFDRIGAVLAQVDDNGNERVIAYGSKAMNKHELGYCITRKELLAIVYFTEHFKHYLYGKKFNLRTDHKAIVFMLKTKKAITPQFQTWMNHLSSLDMKMEYRKGENHTNADALSRTSCKECVQCQTIHDDPKSGKLKTKILSLMTQDEGIRWQKESAEIDKIKIEVSKGLNKKFKIVDETVYTIDSKIWIPHDKVNEFVKYIHEILCHAGSKKVQEYIERRFDMNNRSTNIKVEVQNCESCQKRKAITTRTMETILKTPVNDIFEIIYIDFCGPFKTTRTGKKYILAIIDKLSKYVSLNAVADQSENIVAKSLLKHWILKFGAPKIIHCDRGRSFESKLIKEKQLINGKT